MSDPFADATFATRQVQQARARTLVHVEPNIVENGHSIAVDPEALRVRFQEAQTAIAEALAALTTVKS
jgi:hypothetical protein